MTNIKHKVFLSYHHANDQWAKDHLIKMNKLYDIFIDKSVDTGDIDDNLPDETIRVKIRDEYLCDSTVTLLLVGKETKHRKHIDWELYSSMRDSEINKKSGILVVMLPTVATDYYTAGHGDVEKSQLYPDTSNWIHIDSRTEFESRYPYMPDRIIDCLLMGNSYISVVNWDKIENSPEVLRRLIEWTNRDKESCDYDLSRPMRRRNG